MLTPEQDAELDELNRLGTEAAAALQSPWEPACVARAFAAKGAGALAFTMQTWIDLEAIRSPLLHGEMPADAEAFAAAAEIFGCAIGELDADEIAALGGAMRRVIAEGFAMNLPMRPENAVAGGEGFGVWLPIFTALVVECGVQPPHARAMAVGAAYALLAALRRAQGWHCTGTEYALREAAATDASAPLRGLRDLRGETGGLS